MSLISDIKAEIIVLPSAKKDLRKFGILVGGVFLVLCGLIFFTGGSELSGWTFLIVGGFLFLSGLIIPAILKKVYLIWMTGALVLGWIMSRVIIAILFFFILTPIALIAKMFGKKFLDLDFRDGKTSYWVIKEAENKINYTKMY
jgi:hypothetical protein